MMYTDKNDFISNTLNHVLMRRECHFFLSKLKITKDLWLIWYFPLAPELLLPLAPKLLLLPKQQ